MSTERIDCLWGEKKGKGEGLLVAADVSAEWQLPWWWERYRSHNDFPVLFVDLGMSSSMHKWCQERGECLSLSLSDSFMKEREEIDPKLLARWEVAYGSFFFASRPAFFKKPLCCLKSPFARTIWCDLDCEIRGSLKELFGYAEGPLGMALAKEPNGSIWNGGVIAFSWGAPLMVEWARAALEQNHLFATDQDLLSKLIREKKEVVRDIPPLYNWSRTQKGGEEAKIFHWHGVLGKKEIYRQIISSSWPPVFGDILPKDPHGHGSHLPQEQ